MMSRGVSMMVSSYLVLVNNFLVGLSYNTQHATSNAPPFVHPNAIDAFYSSRSNARRLQHELDAVSYDLATQHTGIGIEMSCGHGCVQCSAVNGCLSCRRPFFLTLQRKGPRQIALCQRSCPEGFYKARYSRKRFCAICQRGCQWCKNGTHCVVCQDGYTAQHGDCKLATGVSWMETSMPSSDPQHQRHVILPPVLLTNNARVYQLHRRIPNTSRRTNVNRRYNKMRKYHKRRTGRRKRYKSKKRKILQNNRHDNSSKNVDEVTNMETVNNTLRHNNTQRHNNTLRHNSAFVANYANSHKKRKQRRRRKRRKLLRRKARRLNIHENDIPVDNGRVDTRRRLVKFATGHDTSRLSQPRVTLVRPSRHARHRRLRRRKRPSLALRQHNLNRSSKHNSIFHNSSSITD